MAYRKVTEHEYGGNGEEKYKFIEEKSTNWWSIGMVVLLLLTFSRTVYVSHRLDVIEKKMENICQRSVPVGVDGTVVFMCNPPT